MEPEKRDLSVGAVADLAEQMSGVPIVLEPRIEHPITFRVRTIAARSVRPLDFDLELSGRHDGGRAVLAVLGEAGANAAFWEARVGNGRLWVSRYADLFGNVSLGESDNARLLANMIALSLGPNGRVIFDDMHQGASDLYDPRAFFSDPRLFATMGFIAGFWLLYLVGSSRRLAPPRQKPMRYYAADLARAMAGLLVRRVDAVTMSRQLFAHFFNDIRARYGMPTNGEPVWRMLGGMSQVSRRDLAELRAHYARASAGLKVDAVALARTLKRTRESLS